MISEVYAFLAAILCGVFSVSLYQAFAALRKTLGSGRIISAVSDILWWCIVAVVFSICMWELLSLRVRAFEFLGVAIGAFLWNILLGRHIKRLFELIFAFILKIIRFIFKILLTPSVFLYKILVVGKTSKFKKGKRNERHKKEASKL